jgi:cytochrome P450
MHLNKDSFYRDPCLPGVEDPYATYAALREQCAIHWCEGPQMWAILGHAEVTEHMRDPRYSRQNNLDKLIERFGEKGSIFKRQKLDIPFMDGDLHRQMRQHVMNAYRGIDLKALSRFSSDFASSRLDQVTGQESFDLVALLASSLPIMVVNELMGVPRSMQSEVADQVESFVRARGLTQTEDTASEGEVALKAFGDYFLPLIHQKRQDPGDDVLSRLIADPKEGIHLTDEQLLLIISSNFYSASVYTLKFLIGTMAWTMAIHPEAYTRIRYDRSLIPGAVEEALRWDPPAQALNASMAMEDIVIDGQIVKAGDSVTAFVGAANRDPKVFDQPDLFLVDRSPNTHLSFAPGLHQCLGLNLARMEGAAVLSALCDQFESLSWHPSGSKRAIGDRFRGFDLLILSR